MKKILVAVSALFALAIFARPAHAEEKNPGKLMKMLTDKLESFKDMGDNFKTNPKFKEFIKYTCQKGNAFGGTFGVCRSGEGIVCGVKKEAFVACSVVCGAVAGEMSEAAGFAESKCVTKHAGKWGFADSKAAVVWAKHTIKTKPAEIPVLQKFCPVLKKVAGKLPPAAKEFAEACP